MMRNTRMDAETFSILLHDQWSMHMK